MIWRQVVGSTVQERAAKPVPAPDKARLKEAIRLWALAAAADNGSPAPVLPAGRLDAETAKVGRAISRTYGKASDKELVGCRFSEFSAEQVGRAAKRLLMPSPQKSK